MSKKSMKSVDKIVKTSLSVVVASTLFSTPLTVLAEENKEREKTEKASAIDQLLETMQMESNIPKGQKKVAYTNNYQSMEEEGILYRSGTGTHAVNNGLSINAASTGPNKFMGVWEKSPYMSSGVITVKFTTSKPKDNGFVIKSSDGTPGLAIRHESGGKWVIQQPSASGSPYEVTPANPLTELKADEEATMQIGFYQNRLIITFNGTTVYDKETIMAGHEGLGAALGQVGVYSREAGTNFIIKDIDIKGVGTEKKPMLNYQQDYEDSPAQSWSSGVTASVIDDGTGNKVLNLKGTKDGRVTDLNSPDITDGTISLDYKVKTKGSGFAFGFRYGDDAKVFNELGVDGANAWVPEASSGWGSNLGLPAPIVGKWNNIMINFQGQNIRIFLNKELVGETTFDKFSTGPGKFGLRLRGTEIQLDNVRYTDEILTPKEIVQYDNDFQDNITGNWSNATPKILAEGTNKILHLVRSGDAVSMNEDTMSLSEGSTTFRMKSSSKNIGFRVGTGTITWKGDHWSLLMDKETTERVFPMPKAAFEPLEKTWNNIGAQFTQSSITLSVNGVSSTINGLKVGEGKFGIVSEKDAYIDDLIYSEKTMDMNTSLKSDKMYYEEYYETDTNVNYKNLNNYTIQDGRLVGTIAQGSTAENLDVTQAANGIYQIKLKSNLNAMGIQVGNAKFYSTGEGKWKVAVGAKEAIDIGSASQVVANEDIIISVKIVEGKAILNINNKELKEVAIADFVAGNFGVYNPTTSAMNVSIEEQAAEETRIYKPSYASDDALSKWTNTKGSVSFAKGSEANQVVAKMVQESMSLDKAGPAMLDQHVSFDFKTNVDATTSGGRYGVLLRGTSDKDYAAIEHDVSGNWRVKVNGSDYAFKKTMVLNKDKTYGFDIDLVGNSIALKITDKESKVVVDMGNISIEEMPTKAGYFGLRSWWGNKDITITNLKMVEDPTIQPFNLAPKTSDVTKDKLTVTLDEQFPRIISYKLNGKVMKGQEEFTNSVLINGKKYAPSVTSTLNSTKDKRTYLMNIEELGVEIRASYQVEKNNVVNFKVEEIKETKDFKVTSFAFDQNTVAYADSGMSDASYAWTKSNGQWHGVSEELADHTSEMDKSETIGTTFAIVSGNGLAASIENNIMSGGNKTVITKEKKQLIQKTSLSNGTWTYRYDTTSDKTEALPWSKVVISEDINDDKKTDWQDGAVAFRDYIFTKPFEAEDMANNMMYIAFNFASQTNDPFLNTLDNGKVLYNYTDGFGQMILHKGYQGEGHDDDIPSYSNIGVRQGGEEDFNKLIDEGDKYNLNIGVHLNATEYHLDANELMYDDLTNAAAGNLAKGWDWIDTAYYVDQTKEVLDGTLQKRFKDLYDLTKDESNPNDPALDFYYIDVYTGNDYNASKLLEYANKLGVKVGTEFSGPLEPGVNFVHWGPDLGYPNKGNKSILSRMVKNNQDLFVGNALFKGQKIPGVTTWGDSKPDVQQGVTVFNNEVLPTKYMQHHGVLKYDENKITFEDNLTSERNKDTKMIELKKDGNLISSWADTGTTTSEDVRHTGEANSLIPWTWDIKTNKVLTPDDGAKMYHWNTKGGTTTWNLTDDFKDVDSFTLYELTQEGKINRGTVKNVNGKVSIDGKKNTPYILYKTGVKPLEDAGNWGEGSAVKDFAFNGESIDGTKAWNHTGNAEIKVIEGKEDYTIDKEMKNSNWNRYAQINGEGTLTQSLDLANLKPGKDYTVSVWTEVGAGATSTLDVKIGDKVYTNNVTGLDKNHQSSFKYVNTNWQRLSVEFSVPTDVSEGSITLSGTGGIVKYDDVKAWEHTTNEKDVRNEDFVVKEDFENTTEGWGPFEYGGGSRKISITNDKSNKNDNNDIVEKGSGKMGPIMTWVLDGQNSLKVNETDVNKNIKTNEDRVKLEPNRTFKLNFDYTMENQAIYEVIVKSRSTGKIILQEDLENIENNGESGKTKQAYNHYEKEFTTDELSDYQVIFNEKVAKRNDKGEAFKTSEYAFILDNFSIEKTSRKEVLQSMVDEFSKLDESAYTKDSWATFKTSMEHAQRVLDDTTSSAKVIDDEIVALQSAKDKLVKQSAMEDLRTLVKDCETLLSQEEDYSKASWTTFETALQAAKAIVTAKASGQDEAINIAYKNLQDAKDGLVDITELASDIKTAETIKNENYTSASWSYFEAGIKEAKGLLDTATQKSQVSTMQEKLSLLTKNLMKKGNLDNLKTLVAKASTLSQANYTSATWNSFISELTSANDMIAKNDATQAEIDDLYQALDSAMKQLVELSTSLTDKASGVTVFADNGVLPEGTTLQVKTLEESDSIFQKVKKTLGDKLKQLKIFDIALSQATKEVEINGKVFVQIELPKSFTDQNLGIFSVADDGTLTRLNAQVQKGNIIFEKGKGNLYALAQFSEDVTNPGGETTPPVTPDQKPDVPSVDKETGDVDTGDTTRRNGYLVAGIISLGAIFSLKRKKKEEK